MMLALWIIVMVPQTLGWIVLVLLFIRPLKPSAVPTKPAGRGFTAYLVMHGALLFLLIYLLATGQTIRLQESGPTETPPAVLPSAESGNDKGDW